MKSALKYLVYFAPLGVFAALIAVFLLQLGKDPSILPSARLNKPVPEFALSTLAQKPVTQAAFAGGAPKVMNVFASWCQPCWAEHAVITDLAAEGIPIIGWAYKDSPNGIKRFLAQLGNPYTQVVMDEVGRAAIDFGVYGAPETYVIDGNGIIRYRYVGALTQEAIDLEIRPLLAALSAGAS